MHVRDRLIVADPQVSESRLAETAQREGCWALVDATRPNARQRLANLEAQRTILRVGPEQQVRSEVGMAVISAWTIEADDVASLGNAIEAWQAAGVPAAVEVRSTQEARRARDAGADALVARGGEGPGRASDTSSLVLLPALAELELPLIAWGGAGPNATGALLVHADMVVLDAQLYALPEAGLSPDWQRALRAFDGADIAGLGSTLAEPFYALARPADEHVHELWETEQAQASKLGPTTRRNRLRAHLEENRAHWEDGPREGIHALGADAAHADFFAEQGSLPDAISHIEQRVAQQADAFPLVEDSPLAQAHGTKLPVVQGAMANVSEEPDFARAVADAGALPFLAFASLREHWAEEVLEGTIETLDDEQTFGCGIIGLDLNETKRDAHMRLIRERQPDKALIAAGTVEQARELEDAGVDTYLHTPSRGLVRSAIEAELDHVVVEGNECGGHIGKLPSLVLWDVALQEIADVGEDVRVLLAGGISDDETAAMAGTLAAGIEQARVGVLMGTAYLATEEIVEAGAITPAYQRLVLASRKTEVTGETVGIRARSAPTPFTDRVQELEQELVGEGVDLDERKQRVEDENLGATRLAAQGVERDEEGTYYEVPTDKQLQEGNYLMGQGAELIEDIYTVEDLHRRVTDDAAAIAQKLGQRLARPPTIATTQEVPEDAIAIVGLGGIFPDAPDVDTFWENILDGHVSIRELPEDRWPVDPTTHLSSREELADDGTYTLLGGFIDPEDVDFDPIEHRIPPRVADQMDESQQWAILAAQQALEDADLLEDEQRDTWGVLLGNALGGEQRTWTERRLALREALETIEHADVDPEDRQRVRAEIEGLLDDLPAITEDTMPGELANVIASRVCHVFDIGGPARTTDAACASTLAAVEDAVNLLRSGDVDVALTGGVDRSMDPAAYAKFSAIGALSDEGSFPFDERASGFVMGEGCGILVLKRLEDAIEDGDEVYACIRGVGSSSDGRGKGITAPNPSGQQRAVHSALDNARIDPEDVGLIEAHGTGTPVGDPTEVETIEAVLAQQETASIGLGSVKSNIGHLKAAAGAAGLIKATKAIQEATLPPTVVDEATSEVDWEQSPLALVREPTPWEDDKRVAGVSAFGFGGTNSHVVLSAGPQARTRANEDPTEPELFSAPSREALLDELDKPANQRGFDPEDRLRVAHTPEAETDTIREAIVGELPPQVAMVQGVVVADQAEATDKLGLVFPGQGSQYPQMALELAEHFPAAREVLEEADQVLTPLLGQPLTDVLEIEGEEGSQALTPTEICQPAVLTADIAVLRTLEEMGVEPDIVAGHSLGEYAALVAAGTLSFADALHAVSARGQEMADVEVDDPGSLVALETDRTGALELIDDLDAWPANVNGPTQTVVAGTTPALEALQQRAEEQDIRNAQLQVSAAFHSPIVAPATQPLRNVLERIPIDPPEIPVVANATGEPYPEDPDEIRDLLAEQVQSPVEWVTTMDSFAQFGTDLIVEAGPGRVLSGLAQANLEQVPAVPTMHERSGEIATLSRTRLALAAAGHDEKAHHAQDSSQQQTASSRTGRPAGANVASPPGQPTPDAAQQTQPSPHAGTASTAGTPRTVVTGVSLGVPGVEDPFAPEAREALLEGNNLITRIGEAERDRMASMGIRRLDKNGPGGPAFEPVDDPDDVVKLAGRIADVDLSTYGVDEDWLDNADATARLAVAAALEALSDASIPLVPDEHETSTGTTLQEGWSLPEPMQEETGIILASAFPGYDSLLDIVQANGRAKGHSNGPAPTNDASHTDAPAEASRRSATASPSPVPDGGASPDVLVDAIDRLAEHIDDPEGRRELMDWAAQTHQRSQRPAETSGGEDPSRIPSPAPSKPGPADASQDSPAPFPRDFLFRVLGMGHAQVAQLLDARGPNLHVNAACASTTSAIALAQDWIQQGRCKRVIVLGADVAGNENLLPWIGGGFMAAGAASTAGDIDEAALPFDQRRNGMLVGSGAVGLVVETAQAADERGVTPLAEITATNVVNSAFHGARLDTDHVSQTFANFLDGVRASEGLDVPEFAEDLVFVSHEPATPPRGGSAEAEIQALQAALGDSAEDVLVTNTKGLTGHAMGAGLEDGIAVELLRRRQAPPVANLENPDPGFEDMTFSQGDGTDRSRSLRFAAGFGSQVAMVCFERTAQRPGEVDRARFDTWLASTVGEATLRRDERLLRATPPGSTAAQSPRSEALQATEEQPHAVNAPQSSPPATTGQATSPASTNPSAARRPGAGSEQEDLSHRSPTAGAGGDGPPSSSTPSPQDGDTGSRTNGAPSTRQPAGDEEAVQALLVDLVSRKTGYPEDVIEPEMDLEADLGVDTVKQAEVLAEARDELDIPPIEGLSLADVPTVEDAAHLLSQHTDAPANQGTPPGHEGEGSPEPGQQTSGPNGDEATSDGPPDSPTPASDGDPAVQALLIDLVSRKTGYPEDVIEPEMDLEADLGVDTVKQAEVLAEARDELDIPPIEGLSLADVPTVHEAANLLSQHTGSGAGEGPAASEESSSAAPESAGEEAADLIHRTRLTRKPAPAPEGRLRPASIEVDGPLVEGVEALLRDAVGGEDPELTVIPVQAQASAEQLTDLLARLQQLPEQARTVLVADAEQAIAAGLGPLAATLRAEEIPARAVLVGEEVTEARLADELVADTEVDVRLDASMRRQLGRAPTEEGTLASGIEIEEPFTVLAPGGLGAAVQPCLVELAREHEIEIALVGRSPLGKTRVDPDDEEDVQRLREDMLEQAREDEEDLTPAQIEDRVQREVRKARRVQAFGELDELADVRYHQADATDAEAIDEILQQVDEHSGGVDVVVHGVGVDRSRAFLDKTREDMHTVLDAKLTPVQRLVDVLSEAHHVAFGSIAGAYGNLGQADYALANGCLTGLLAPVDGTVIHWTAWDAAGGMADDDTVRRVLEEREITFLDPDEGARVFVDTFAQPGSFLVSDLGPDTPLTPSEGTEETSLVLTGDEHWLADHQVAARNLFPGVRYVQSARDAAGQEGRFVDGFHDVRFQRPAWVEETTRLRVHLGDNEARIQQDETVHARMRLGEGPGVKPVEQVPPEGEDLEAEEIYERLFHGPSFQVLQTAQIGEEHVTAQAELEVGGAAPWALAIEAAMQAAGLAGSSRQLPVGIKALSIEQPAPGSQARVDARLVATDATGSTWDATIRVDDTPVVHARGIRLQRTDATGQLASDLVALKSEDVTASAQPVPVLDPRIPREKQTAEHEAGQAAAARAIQEAIGPEAELSREQESSRPVVANEEGWVSITHGHGLAIAAASNKVPVGVDLERIESRSQAWREDNLTPEEQEVLAASGLEDAVGTTLAWTLKEAAAKAIGTGLSEPATSYEVESLDVDEQTARIQTPEGAYVAAWTRIGEDIVASSAQPAT